MVISSKKVSMIRNYQFLFLKKGIASTICRIEEKNQCLANKGVIFDKGKRRTRKLLNLHQVSNKFLRRLLRGRKSIETLKLVWESGAVLKLKWVNPWDWFLKNFHQMTETDFYNSLSVWMQLYKVELQSSIEHSLSRVTCDCIGWAEICGTLCEHLYLHPSKLLFKVHNYMPTIKVVFSSLDISPKFCYPPSFVINGRPRTIWLLTINFDNDDF